MHSLATLIDTHGVQVHEHLDRDELIPVHTGLQFQGDVAVFPETHLDLRTPGTRDVPAEGIAVVRGENGGNTHLLLAGGAGVTWAPATRLDVTDLDLGRLTVPEGSTAWLAHPEHGYVGIGAGGYTIRRQREQAEAVRLVAD